MAASHLSEWGITLFQNATTVAQSQSQTSATVLQLLQTMALLLPVLAGLVQVILRTQSEREGYVSHAGLMGLIAASGGVIALLTATWRLTGHFGPDQYASVVTQSIFLTKLALFAIGLSVLFVGLAQPAEKLIDALSGGAGRIRTELAKLASDDHPIDEPRPLSSGTETTESLGDEEHARTDNAKDVTTDEER